MTYIKHGTWRQDDFTALRQAVLKLKLLGVGGIWDLLDAFLQSLVYSAFGLFSDFLSFFFLIASDSN